MQQEPGKIESEMAEYGAAAVIKKILTDRTPGPTRLPKENPFGSHTNHIKLPPWFTEEDLKYYAQKYNQKGFTGGLNYYRTLDLYVKLLCMLCWSPSIKYTLIYFTWNLQIYLVGDEWCRNWELTAAWTGAKVRVPVKFIVGDLDMVYTTPGVKEYVHGGGFKNDVPMLEECIVMKNTGHFINQERAQEINASIHDFFNKFWTKTL